MRSSTRFIPVIGIRVNRVLCSFRIYWKMLFSAITCWTGMCCVNEVHFGMPSKETPLPIVYFKLLLHRFTLNGLLKAKVQTYFQMAKLFML